MKIAIDISPLHTGHKVRGVGFYLSHLKAALESAYSRQHDFVFFQGDIPKEKVDVIHFPYFDPFTLTLPIKNSTPTVVTIHDLTPIVFKEHFPTGMRGRLNWEINKQQLRFIDGIITDSHSSTSDVLKHIPISSSKVQTVHLAAGEEFKPEKLSRERVEELRKKYKLPEKFALYVGDVTWNKNLPRLLQAAIQAEIPLVLVGKAIVERDFDIQHPWNKDRVLAQSMIQEHKNMFPLGFVSSGDLVSLYNLATVFVMPSLYEGFGLPVIEALACGIPVVTSREGSLAEVGGDAVYYVDAYDTKSISNGIRLVFDSPDLQKSLSKQGLERAKLFSWEKTAEETFRCYQKFLNTR